MPGEKCGEFIEIGPPELQLYVREIPLRVEPCEIDRWEFGKGSMKLGVFRTRKKALNTAYEWLISQGYGKWVEEHGIVK